MALKVDQFEDANEGEHPISDVQNGIDQDNAILEAAFRPVDDAAVERAMADLGIGIKNKQQAMQVLSWAKAALGLVLKFV